ncbi:conserved hypothetical protein [Solidesulfovibrio fructosivorans JJ]]|uniref:Uncharacterized protein n=1 Tax=Solidesulfovibrio fructosivorans JJ] TaxID=596151 RepID=E1K007_SOLFR|nr:hypothetical protein [Solidesulfovibrio fructosivorans]EFL50013.1 conserved hypothetical protein [Solidesulfovibrio fructosivorans JJ]]
MDAIDTKTTAAGGAFEQQKLGAELVTKTLDRLNTDLATGGVNQDYDFQTKVLSAATGVGGNLNIKA